MATRRTTRRCRPSSACRSSSAGEPGATSTSPRRVPASFTEADEQALLVLADWAAIAISNADLYRGAARAPRRAGANGRRARGHDVDRPRARCRDGSGPRPGARDQARARARRGARDGHRPRSTTSELVVRAVAGAVTADLLGPQPAASTGVWSNATASGVDGDERLAGEATRLRRTLAREVGATSGLLVPLRYRDETVGVLAAFDRADGEGGFSADEERLLEAFAASAATAVVTAQRVAASTLRRRVEAAEHERRALGPRAARRESPGPRGAEDPARLGPARCRRRSPRHHCRRGDRPPVPEHRGPARPDRRPAPRGARPARCGGRARRARRAHALDRGP